MTYSEFKNKIVDLICYCDINQRYSQRLAWWYGLADKSSKIAVAVVAVVAVVLALLDEGWKNTEIVWAIAAAVLAVVLNVLPFGEYEKFYDEMFRCWSDLRIDAELQKLKNRGESQSNIPDHAAERFQELRQKQYSLNAEEPAPWGWLLNICQRDMNQRHWGVRTNEQVREEGVRCAGTPNKAPLVMPGCAEPETTANPHQEVVQ